MLKDLIFVWQRTWLPEACSPRSLVKLGFREKLVREEVGLKHFSSMSLIVGFPSQVEYTSSGKENGGRSLQ